MSATSSVLPLVLNSWSPAVVQLQLHSFACHAFAMRALVAALATACAALAPPRGLPARARRYGAPLAIMSATATTGGDLMATEFALICANKGFYEAFRKGDASKMRKLLSGDENMCVIHPGQNPIIGRDRVLHSWARVLNSPPAIQCTDVQVQQIVGDVAWVTCTESVDDRDDVRLAATNIFKRDPYDLNWKLVFRQAGACLV